MNTTPPIRLRGVKQNNLKNIDVSLPQKKLTVVTGLSGSGKSTLAFETLYAEGQRRYVESLSTYTRQFLEKMPKPDLETIENIPPAIALEQRNTVLNSRSTVATQTEMLDFLRLFYSKLGTRICDVCKSVVVDITPDALKREILLRGLGRKFALLAPLAFSADAKPKGAGFIQSYFTILNEQGFRRVYWTKTKEWFILDEPAPKHLKGEALLDGELYLLMDRFNWSEIRAEKDLDKDSLTRYYDSMEQALKYGHEKIFFLDLDEESGSKKTASKHYQTGFACLECGSEYTKPTPQLFSFQSPIGACPTCNGFGHTLEVDRAKVIPAPGRALNDGAIDPLDKPSNKDEYREFLKYLSKNGLRASASWDDLSNGHQKLVWEWVLGFFKDLQEYKYKFHIRIFIRRYQSAVECTSCHGSRLRPEALKIEVHGKNVSELLSMPVSDLLAWFKGLKLTANEKSLLKELYPQIVKRLEFLVRVGVPYLTLNRLTRSLSGGEFQRINLATHLGNGLCGTLYVLDEPTIGLHPYDTDKLLDILRELRDQGNTLVVVEHETKILEDADWIVELGPDAGRKGGTLTAQGTPEEVSRTQCRTAKFLKKGGQKLKRTHKLRTVQTPTLSVLGCTEHNLKNIDVDFPLNKLVVVTGVSGSGKTTLVHQTLAKAIEFKLAAREADPEDQPDEEADLSQIGAHKKITGLDYIQKLILLDQKPIGKNSRSNPATYLKAWDEVRKLYAAQPLALSRGYSAGHFSFNVDGGRCPTCKGEGEITIDMHFMAEVKLKCEDCEGKRFIKSVLDVKYKNKSVSDVLTMTIDDAFDLFHEHPVLRQKLDLLREVGLGYLEVGQSGPTLSGGEAQRLKIASALDQEANSRTHDLFILDEPTTGLHQDDVMKLLEVLHNLVNRGKSVILIEHNLDVIMNSDYVIDLGPEGGARGGELIAAGTPEALMKHKDSKTGAALKAQS
ncbi:MAG: excinuclease ABC subunit UvrA [Bdellovibrionales bacterium]|nr:excinuclease ABC subunit UvrA [Bdellovibrionales bacterium]